MLASLGCGNPTALAELNPGETVLDLGSGGGIDVLLSARRVGPTGKAYGLDMTDEMLALARENQRKAGVDERRVPQRRNRAHSAARQLGRRHHLELRHQSLGRQGPRAARSVSRAEARRAVRGVRRRDARRGAGRDAAEHGAVGRLHRRRARRRRVSQQAGGNAGFEDIDIEPTRVYDIEDARAFLAGQGIDVDAVAPQVEGKFMSAFVRATKPKSCCAPGCCA